MKYAWKLLIILLAFAVVPPLVIRSLGVRNLKRLGEEVIRETAKSRESHLVRRLQLMLEAGSEGIEREIGAAATTLRLQALEIDRLLSRVAAADALSDLKTVYPALAGRPVIRHQTVLLSGRTSAYPGYPSMPQQWDPTVEAWFTGAFGAAGKDWIGWNTDPVTGRTVVTAARAVKSPDGRIAGVTAVVVSVGDLLADLSMFRHMPPGTRSFIVNIGEDPQAGLAVVARTGRPAIESSGAHQGDARAARLDSGDGLAFQDMISDLRAGRKRVRRMTFEGMDSLWAYTPLVDAYALVLIAPVTPAVSAETGHTDRVGRLIESQRDFSLYLMVAMTVIATGLALLLSRTVTQRLRILTQGVRHLAAGNFNTMVDIRSRDEFGELGRVFNSLGPLLEERIRVRKLMELATEVQSNLLPRSDPEFPGLDVSGSCQYCDRLGGDYFDYVVLGEHREGKFGIVVGDVAGHGIPAALVMTTARALLRQRVSFPGCTDCYLGDINRHLYRDAGESGQFMTLFYCEFDTREKSVRWVSAGHDPALTFDPDTGEFSELHGRGIALGVLEDVEYSENRRDMHPGQIYLFGTDGLWETRNADGEMFGKIRLMEVVRAHADRPADAIRGAVLTAVADFRGHRSQEDDITLVIVRIEG